LDKYAHSFQRTPAEAKEQPELASDLVGQARSNPNDPAQRHTDEAEACVIAVAAVEA